MVSVRVFVFTIQVISMWTILLFSKESWFDGKKIWKEKKPILPSVIDE